MTEIINVGNYTKETFQKKKKEEGLGDYVILHS